MKNNDTDYNKNIHTAKCILASLAVGVTIFYVNPQVYAANTVVPNNTVPSGGQVIAGQFGSSDFNPNGTGISNIFQQSQNGVLSWKDFSIGANAIVNFNGPNNFNTLNYVPRGSASQIYGTLNANNKGNIFVVNPAGVQIGKSAQINVGNLYVSNRDLGDLSSLKGNINPNIDAILNNGKRTNAELMSLGNINANKVTFDGDRVVIDVDRVRTLDSEGRAHQIDAEKLIVNTTDKNNVVIGYSGYDDVNKTYNGKNTNDAIAKVNNSDYTKKDGYMWIKTLEQMQAMNTNKDGNYALNNAIDAIPTKDWNNKEGFESIQGFSGKFDGLDNNIFGLTINRANEDNVGLFGSTNGATIKNVTLVNGDINGKNNVGAVVGNAVDTKVENIISSAKVTGMENVGGIIGSGENADLSGLINTGTISGNKNVGGLAGSLKNSSLETEKSTSGSYNLGSVVGIRSDKSEENTTTGDEIKKNDSQNIGGLVGSAENSILGSKDSAQIFNQLDVQGGYNVGGIAGSMADSIVQNAANNGNITATGYTSEMYNYHGNESGGLNEDGKGSYGDNFYTDKGKTINNVNASNVGGIAGNVFGGEINQVINTGDIETAKITKNLNNKDEKYELYAGGNVGGIAGRVNGTDIDNAENKENAVFGAHNIGGIAGYLESGTVSNSINNGGEIVGTGALRGQDFAKEIVVDDRDKKNNIGNIGGVVGYMYGDKSHIQDSSNRGYVHTLDELKADGKFKDNSKAGNIGGVVGKIDRTQTLGKDALGEKYINAAVSNSYNTGNIKGYINVGGIAGMMYNGEVAGSYNSGALNTTKTASNMDTLNMGGIVGDTTEGTNARVLLYDVYNRGDIGDKDFDYGSRHVGGIVGRLSGEAENSYNKGNIYNNAVATGGVVGWMTKGSVQNSFNAGNITVLNKDTSDWSGIGGIVGGTGYAPKTPEDDTKLNIKNVYNLGVLRNFADGGNKNSLGGIVGVINHGTKALNIENVYTTGELYLDTKGTPQNEIGSIYGSNQVGGLTPTIKNAYYIKPKDGSGFTEISGSNNQSVGLNKDTGAQDAAKGTVEYYDKDKAASYAGLFTDGNSSDTSGDWRIYDGTTPILNAFLPKLAEGDNITSKTENVDKNKVQFGNAYNPFATIIDANGKDIIVNDKDAGAIDNVDSVIVKNGSLTVNNAANSGNTMYNGILYADGKLSLNGADNANISLGSISNLYGSSVDVKVDGGELKAYGSITATGNEGESNININADKDIEILGTITSKGQGEKTEISGIGSSAADKDFTGKDISKPKEIMPEVGGQYKVTAENGGYSGDVNITSKDGNVNALYGNLGNGYINSSRDVMMTGKEVYTDADLKIGGNLYINADKSVLDISNIGKVEAAKNNGKQVDYLHGTGNFLDHFSSGTNSINFASSDGKGNTDAMIAVDMWDGDKGEFDLKKYDNADHTFSDDLSNLKINGKNEDGKELSGRNMTHIWIADGGQLAGIQDYKDNVDTNSKILEYNFALKNDIDASHIGGNYQSIGSNGTEFKGTFDGRGNRIVGLDTSGTPTSSALFDTIGTGGTVKDVKVYSINITSSDKGSGGVIANTNNGTIDGISAFGNSVSGDKLDGGIGGVVGTNNGIIKNTTASSVVQNMGTEPDEGTFVGGIAGINTGTIENSESSSAVTSDKSLNMNSAMGGIAGKNEGTLTDVVSKGVTTGLYDNEPTKAQPEKSYKTSGNIGGITGINTNKISGAYNESITSGMENVGGVVGNNSGSINNLANATYVYGGDNVGGIAGSNDGTLNNGRNNGEIIGGKNIHGEQGDSSKGENIGGLVGVSGENSDMQNLTNDMSASITGHTNVGGLIGLNKGTFTDGQNLMNSGTISGVKNVGGSIGQNDTTGKVHNVNTVNKSTIEANTAYGNKSFENFGGVIGQNSGTAENMSNSADVNLDNAAAIQGSADSLGGIIGNNTGTVSGVLLNGGDVTGKNKVGGIIGTNKAEINGAHLVNGAVAHVDENGKTDWSKYDLKDSKISGTENVGGVIGQNKGKITHTDVVNTIKGQVEGVNNVGGVIGTNSAEVAGGRDINDNYYKYHIVNNGSVTGTGENAGGLIGKNTGTLIAGYNTGSVAGGTNVGGVAGCSSGTIDQVFSNTTEVSGKNKGSVIGQNDGTLSNAYGIGIDIEAVGQNSTKNGTNTFNWASEDAAKNTTVNDSKWKNQTGLAAPMLKVFLTKAVFHPADGVDLNAVYNAKNQGFRVEANGNKVDVYTVNKDGGDTYIGYIVAADAKGAHSLADYFNTKGSGKDLINGNQSAVDAGTYDMFYSHQINTNGKDDNPNNLGYDFVQGKVQPGDDNTPKFDIDKRKLNISLDDVYRIYGNGQILDKDGNKSDYKWTIGNWANDEEKAQLEKLLGIKVDKDGGLANDPSNPDRVTNDAGDYTWLGLLTGLDNDALKNYTFDGKLEAGSHVKKADLTIDVNDADINKGEKPNYSGSITGIVNGDSKDSLGLGKYDITDTNYEGQTGRHENVIGTVITDKNGEKHVYINGKEVDADLLKNYDITIKPGDLNVKGDTNPGGGDKPDPEPVPNVPDGKWDYLHKDAPWDRVRNFRERKAEFNYQSGGTKIDEADESKKDSINKKED